MKRPTAGVAKRLKVACLARGRRRSSRGREASFAHLREQLVCDNAG